MFFQVINTLVNSVTHKVKRVTISTRFLISSFYFCEFLKKCESVPLFAISAFAGALSSSSEDSSSFDFFDFRFLKEKNKYIMGFKSYRFFSETAFMVTFGCLGVLGLNFLVVRSTGSGRGVCPSNRLIWYLHTYL
jgi:hypothetical protein